MQETPEYHPLQYSKKKKKVEKNIFSGILFVFFFFKFCVTFVFFFCITFNSFIFLRQGFYFNTDFSFHRFLHSPSAFVVVQFNNMHINTNPKVLRRYTTCSYDIIALLIPLSARCSWQLRRIHLQLNISVSSPHCATSRKWK